MSMPENVREWVKGASLARMVRDIELATVEASRNIPLDRRQDWLASRKHELDLQHIERVADAEKRWPVAMAEFEQEFIRRMAAKVDGRYG